MPKVVIHPEGEPATAATASAHTPPANMAEFEDHNGRTVRIRRLDPRDNMRLAKLVGADCVKNEEYMIYARAAYVVSAIDGHPVPPPQSVLELEAMADRIGDDDILTVIKTYAEKFMPSEPDLDAVKN